MPVLKFKHSSPWLQWQTNVDFKDLHLWLRMKPLGLIISFLIFQSSVLKYFQYIFFPQNRLKQAKGFISGPSARRTKDLLKLNTDQLRWVVGLLTGHCHLKGHLFKLGLTDDPTYERCLQEDESATHILCDCRGHSLFKVSSHGPVLYGTK
jgi:hypothetical protein